MAWIEQPDGTLLHEESGTIYSEDTPVYFNIYEHEGKAVLFITNEEIPDDIDPRDFVAGDKITTEYFDGDIMRNTVWKDKFKRPGVSTPKKMFDLLSSEFSRIEQKYPNPVSIEKIHQLLDNFKYAIPGGSMLYGIGGNQYVSIANCFVIPGPVDSYGGICKTDEEEVQLAKRRGGLGFDIGNIRKAGSVVHNAAKTSTGIVPFMERYSNSTKEVSQDGRRGALMLTLPLSHPDAMSFITAKMDLNKINHANLSVKVDDEQMLEYVSHVKPKQSTKKLSFAQNVERLQYSSDSIGMGSSIKTHSNIDLLNTVAECQQKSGEPKFWDLVA